MSGGLMILLIIVVWLFVLAPLLLRGQKPMNKAGEGFEDTRVVYEGDSGELPVRPQPRLRAEDVRQHPEEDDADYEVVAAEVDEEEILVEEPKADSDEHVIEGEVVEDAPAAIPAVGEAPSVTEEIEDETEDTGDAEVETVDAYDIDDAYLAPSDLLYRGAPDLALVDGEVGDTAEVDETADEAEAVGTDADAELTEEELAWAKSRAGRGGWDPERDRTYSSNRYQRRQRTLLGLAIAVVLTVAVGIIFGSWTWLLAALAGGLTVLYLFALRKQVREEQALRARRIRHLRRARLGVRSADAEELHIPQQLRRPGAVVLELDDESPDFDYLPETEDYAHHAAPERRGTARGSLRVS